MSKNFSVAEPVAAPEVPTPLKAAFTQPLKTEKRPGRGLAARAILVVLTLSIVCLCPRNVRAGNDTARQLYSAVWRLNVWLGDDNKADGWRESLGLPALETQAALGHRADAETLFRIFRQFDSGANGLEMPPFNDVRNAIARHLHQLQTRPYYDLPSAVAGSRYGYKKTTISELEYARNTAVYDLKILRNYYQSSLASRERAGIYYDLDIDDQIEWLQTLEFELPPDLSTGRLNTQLKKMQGKLDEVIEQLDALPAFEDENGLLIPDDNIFDPPQPDNGDEPNDGGNAIDIQAPPRPDGTPDITAPRVRQATPQEPETEEARQRQEVKRLNVLRDQIKNEMEELSVIRDEVAEKDRPRQEIRIAAMGILDGYNRRFTKVALRRNDPYFLASESSYNQFFMTYFYATDDNLANQHEEKIETLSEVIAGLDDPNARRDIARVGGLLGWLDAADQSRGLASTIRARHSLPNFELSVSKNLINQIAAQDVSDGRRLNELMLGRLIRGEAYTNGRLEVDFVDDPNQANISLHLFGSVDSQTHTNTRSLTSYAGGTGQFEARRTILANVGGLISGEPYGAANIRTQFYGIDSRFKLIQRAAQNEYLKTKEQSEINSSANLKRQMMERFASESDEAIENGRETMSKLAGRIADSSRLLPAFHLRTSSDRLYAIGQKDSASELGATVQHDVSFHEPDVAIRMHESLLCNYINSGFAGRKLTNVQIVEQIIEVAARFNNGEIPEELLKLRGEQLKEENEQFSITFAADRPIQIEFRENSLFLTIYGIRFAQGRSRITGGLSIQVKFLIKQIGNELRLVREGGVEIDYLDDKRPGKLVAFKSFLETRLNKLLAGELTDAENGADGQDEDNNDQVDQDTAPGLDDEGEGNSGNTPRRIVLPVNLLPLKQFTDLPEDSIARDLQLVQFRLELGWLYLGWNHVPGARFGYAGGVVDTPAIWHEYQIEATRDEYMPVVPIMEPSSAGTLILETTVIPDSGQ